jgi:hypothetical protein
MQVSVVGTVGFLMAVKKFKTQLSASNIMAGVFWDPEGVTYVYFLPHGVTVNV